MNCEICILAGLFIVYIKSSTYDNIDLGELVRWLVNNHTGMRESITTVSCSVINLFFSWKQIQCAEFVAN